MNIQDIKKQVNNYNYTTQDILEFIGYGGSDEFFEIEIYEDSKWDVYCDTLVLKNDSDIYSFIISSYSAKGEKLYKNSDDTHTYIMAYDDNYGWDSATIFILKNSNLEKDLEKDLEEE